MFNEANTEIGECDSILTYLGSFEVRDNAVKVFSAFEQTGGPPVLIRSCIV